jgi:hypothetical protein
MEGYTAPAKSRGYFCKKSFFVILTQLIVLKKKDQLLVQ